MTGVMQGHFDTVLWVYGLTTAGLLGYFVTLLLRLKASKEPTPGQPGATAPRSEKSA
jgi:hypothetical protein